MVERKYNGTFAKVQSKKDAISCGAGKSSIFIKANGKVLPCGEFQTFYIGDINQNTIEDIILNPNENLKKLLALNQKDLKTCKPCNSYENCLGGCRARAFEAESLTAPDPMSCIYYK